MIERRTHIGNGLKFDGTQTELQVAALGGFDNTKFYTFECLVNYTNTGSFSDNSGNMLLYDTRLSANPNTTGLIISISDLTSKVNLFTARSGANQVNSQKTFSVGDWIHVVVCMYPSGGNTIIELYIDGELDISISVTLLPNSAVSESRLGYLGETGFGRYFGGTFYRFRKYVSNTTVASASDVREMLNGGSPSSIEPDLDCYLDFNENKGTDVWDKSGNNNHGTLTNFGTTTDYGSGAFVDENQNTAK